MRPRLLTGTKEMAQAFGRWCERAENIRIVTAWATTDCMACEFLEKARSKISTMVVGLDFYTTSPSFLESFLSVIRIGKALQGGTFHPKLYLFEIADRFGCVMGSSNFTRGEFGDNAELNICIEGNPMHSFGRWRCSSRNRRNTRTRSPRLRSPLESGQKAALRQNRKPWKAWDVLERYSRQDREGTAQESSRTEKPVAIAALDNR
jgi:phosphatidylserine/phosphatidylglycerophosphate/cardiolipin synthase-like enzyme